jgi:hypothetical protein
VSASAPGGCDVVHPGVHSGSDPAVPDSATFDSAAPDPTLAGGGRCVRCAALEVGGGGSRRRPQWGMPMREECKHFQSRTYASGEVARFCVLDKAPEAPWRCPEDCDAYERRLADVGWDHGRLVEPALEEEPADAAEALPLLDEAESIVAASYPAASQATARSRRRRWPFGGREGR